MKKNWIPAAIAAAVLLGIATYFLFFKKTTPVTTVDESPKELSSSSSGSSSSSTVSVNLSELPLLKTHPTNPTLGYTYINTEDKMIYSFLGANEWLRIGNTADNFIDEYSSDQEYYNVGASMAAVGMLRDSVWYLLEKAQNRPAVEIIDGDKFESTQGAITLRIPYDDIPGYGAFNRMPVYKVINSGISLTLYLGDAPFPIFVDQQVFPGSMLIPKRDDDNEWTYVKV